LGFLTPASTILPLQILFLNMVTDVFPALALGLGKGDKSVMDLPPRNPKEDIVTNKDWAVIIIYAALISASVIIAVLYCQEYISPNNKILNNVAFTALAFAQLFHVFNMSSPKSDFIVNEITKNHFVWYAIIICSGLIATVYFIPQMRTVLGLEVIPTNAWIVAIVASFIPLISIQIYKVFNKNQGKNLYE
jgi:Ca2+-transporting ATPase